MGDSSGAAVEPTSPRLAKCIRAASTELKPEFAKQGVEVGQWSVFDSEIMVNSMFVSSSAGASVIEMASRVAMQSESCNTKAEADESASATMEAVLKPMFNEKRQKRKEYELGVDSGVASGKTLAQQKHSDVVQKLLVFMDDSIRSRMYDGLSEVPQHMQLQLIERAVGNSGGTDTLRGALYALERLKRWYVAKFGCFGGFRIKEAVIGWFLLENLVPDDLDGHASQSLVAGLRFASKHLYFPFQVSSASMTALSKPPTKTPKQAPSVSVRVVHHFWKVACNVKYSMPLRGASAAFLVLCLAALRGIDAQRSSFDAVFAHGQQFAYFAAMAWDSKQRKSMPWASPASVFGSDAWFEALKFIWSDRDYLFPAMTRGVPLATATSFLPRPASSYMLLRYLREVLALPELGMSAEDAKRLRRHSFRHFVPNIIRLLKFDLLDAFQSGRWQDGHIMPMRYASEVKLVSMVDIVVRALAACEAAFAVIPIEKWPLFGGWENLLVGKRHSVSSESLPEAVVEQAASDAGSSDSSDDSDDEDYVAKRVVTRPRGLRALPPGWTKEVQVLSTGKSVPHYYGPKREYSRSIVGAWRFIAPAPTVTTNSRGMDLPVTKDAFASLAADMFVSVFWEEDYEWFRARVFALSGPFVSLAYDDGEFHVHDFRSTVWRLEEPVSGCSQYVSVSRNASAGAGPGSA